MDQILAQRTRRVQNFASSAVRRGKRLALEHVESGHFSGNRDEVSARAQNRRLSLHRAQEFHESPARFLIAPNFVESRAAPGHAFDPQNLRIAETAIAKFISELVGAMKVRGSEIVGTAGGISVYSRSQSARNNSPEPCVIKKALEHPIDE